MTTPAPTAERLDEIKARFAACTVAVKPMDDHRHDVGYECPLCDGDGYLDSDTFDTAGGDQSYVGLQTFGVGKRLTATNEFVRHLADDFQWLLERAALTTPPATATDAEALAKSFVASVPLASERLDDLILERRLRDFLRAALSAREGLAGETKGGGEQRPDVTPELTEWTERGKGYA